jgi:hypothetical protein
MGYEIKQAARGKVARLKPKALLLDSIWICRKVTNNTVSRTLVFIAIDGVHQMNRGSNKHLDYYVSDAFIPRL